MISLRSYIVGAIAMALLEGCSTAPSRGLSGVPTGTKAVSKVETRVNDSVEVRSYKGLEAKDCPHSVVSLPINVQRSWKALIPKANACLIGKNWFMVEQLGNALSDAEPKGPWGAYYLSLAAEARDDLPRAFWMTDLALKKTPGLVAAKYQRARLLWKTDSFTDAFKELQEVVALDPLQVDAHMMLGQIYMRDYEVEKASKEFKMAIEKRPSELTALDALAEIEVYVGNGVSALSFLERATAIAPHRLDLMVKKAQVHETLLNQLEEALTIYRHIQTQGPKTRWEGTSPVNVIQKIRDLEKVLQGRRDVAAATPPSAPPRNLKSSPAVAKGEAKEGAKK